LSFVTCRPKHLRLSLEYGLPLPGVRERLDHFLSYFLLSCRGLKNMCSLSVFPLAEMTGFGGLSSLRSPLYFPDLFPSGKPNAPRFPFGYSRFPSPSRSKALQCLPCWGFIHFLTKPASAGLHWINFPHCSGSQTFRTPPLLSSEFCS